MRWQRRSVTLIVVLFVVRLLYAAYVPLDLVADEAYYWDWSRQLDWCYYSKPPMVAWIIRLATTLGGSTSFAVRAPAVCCGTMGLWCVYLLSARLFQPRVGFWSIVLCAATPGNSALALLMTIDAPFLFFWTAATYGLWRMLERGPGRVRWIAFTTAATGLGLLSKQTMLAFLVTAWVFVLCSRSDRCEVLKPGLWVVSALSLAFLTPVVLWNSRHNWVTFEHSAAHFEPQSLNLVTPLLRSGEFIVSQFGVVSPITCFTFFMISGIAVTRCSHLTRREMFLLCYSAVPLAGVLLLSFTRRVMPNWPAPFYSAGLVLTAAWLVGQLDFDRPVRPVRWLSPRESMLRRCVVCGVVCASITYLAPIAVPWLGLDGTRLDPCVRLRGWQDLADQVATRRRSVPRPEQTFFSVATGREEASELAFYLPDQPDVYLWNPAGMVASQYDLWGAPRGKEGWDALIVCGGGGKVPPQLASRFRTLTRHSSVAVALGDSRQRQYSLWLGRDYRGATGIAATSELRPR